MAMELTSTRNGSTLKTPARSRETSSPVTRQPSAHSRSRTEDSTGTSSRRNLTVAVAMPDTLSEPM